MAIGDEQRETIKKLEKDNYLKAGDECFVISLIPAGVSPFHFITLCLTTLP